MLFELSPAIYLWVMDWSESTTAAGEIATAFSAGPSRDRARNRQARCRHFEFHDTQSRSSLSITRLNQQGLESSSRLEAGLSSAASVMGAACRAPVVCHVQRALTIRRLRRLPA
jgi:hypothetical protein